VAARELYDLAVKKIQKKSCSCLSILITAVWFKWRGGFYFERVDGEEGAAGLLDAGELPTELPVRAEDPETLDGYEEDGPYPDDPSGCVT
jgi:hypothetical protein